MNPRDFPLENVSPVQPPREFGWLHADEPVSEIRYPSGQTGYLVVRYEDVKSVLSDYRRFSRAATTAADAPRVGAAPIQPGTVLSHDPPEHTRLRAILAPHFNRNALAAHESSMVELARRLLDDLFREPGQADLITAFVRPFGTLAIMQMMGIPERFYDDVCHWSDRAMAMPSPGQDVESQAFAYLREMFRRMLTADDLARDPGSLLMKIVDAAERELIDEFEKLQMAVTVLVAGHETTVSALGKALYRLLADSELLRLFRENLDDPSRFLRELLRTSSSGGGHFVRITTEEVELSGVRIPAGCPVTAPPTGANLDPAIYADPLRFDLERKARDPLTFGVGPHRCLGEHLALMQLRVALSEFVSAMPPDLHPAGDPDVVRWQGSRPLSDLRVAWTMEPSVRRSQ